MSWWRKIRGSPKASVPQPGTPAPASRLILPGWNLMESAADSATWRDGDGDGDVLRLRVLREFLRSSFFKDEAAVVKFCRESAEEAGSGLLEAAVLEGENGSAVWFIYKRLQGHAFKFTGILALPLLNQWDMWCMMASERGITGSREAAVTAELLQEARLTMEWYETSWAQDPYDHTYHGVDRPNLCYVSDDECYDQRFPQHPLSKVRRVLHELGGSLEREERPPRVRRSEGEMGSGTPPLQGKEIKKVSIVEGTVLPTTESPRPRKQ